MTRRALLVTFAAAGDLLAAARAAQAAGWELLDAYTPHPIHGLDEALGLRPTRLPWLTILYGLSGVIVMLWFQLWTTAVDWRLNVGGRPWNSSLAFLAATFEVMVLCAGIGSVLTFLVRSRLYPGRAAVLPAAGVTDDRFALLLAATDASFDPTAVARTLAPFQPVAIEEQLLEEGR